MKRWKLKRVGFVMMTLFVLYMLKAGGGIDTKSTTHHETKETNRQGVLTKKNLTKVNDREAKLQDNANFKRNIKPSRLFTQRPAALKSVKTAGILNKSKRKSRNVSSVHLGSSYFQNRTERITLLDHHFIVPSEPCPQINQPFLVILCLSKYDHFNTRNVIRQTWGSVTKSKIWPINNVNVSDVRLYFVLGRSDLSTEQRAEFRRENIDYGDVIVSDFMDSYYNLTRKVLVGLKWVCKFCPHVKYVLKVDEDTFVHVANLISYLRSLKPWPNGVVIGHVYPHPPVLRIGMWGLDRSVYPYPFFPPYVSGNSYVISRNIIERLVEFSEYLPYVFIEDAAITGILRIAVNASILFDGGFTFFARPPPKLCDFHNNATIKSATKTNDRLKLKIWKSFSMTYSECKRYEAAAAKGIVNRQKHRLKP